MNVCVHEAGQEKLSLLQHDEAAVGFGSVSRFFVCRGAGGNTGCQGAVVIDAEEMVLQYGKGIGRLAVKTRSLNNISIGHEKNLLFIL